MKATRVTLLTLVALALAATIAIIGCGGQSSKVEPATNTPALMPDNREPVNVTPSEAATVWSRVTPSAQNTFCDNYHNFGAGLTVNDVDGNISYDISEHLPDLCATLVTATPPAPEPEQDSNQLDRDQIVQDFAVATVSVSPADACADAVQKNINVTRLYQEAHEPNYDGQTLSHMLFEGRGDPPFNRSDALTMATAYKQECAAAGYKYVRKLPTPTPKPDPNRPTPLFRADYEYMDALPAAERDVLVAAGRDIGRMYNEHDDPEYPPSPRELFTKVYRYGSISMAVAMAEFGFAPTKHHRTQITKRLGRDLIGKDYDVIVDAAYRTTRP